MIEPSEASLRVARELLEPFRSAMDAQFAVARALDRQRERHAQIVETYLAKDEAHIAAAIRESSHG